MPSGLELTQALNATMEQAYEANARAKRSGVALATANADFRAKRAQRELELKAQGHAVSLIHDVAYADAELNRAAMVAEVAKTDYDSDREEVLLRKREADIIREQIQRDWAQAGGAL